jgi:hypothetical protein
MAVVSMSKRGWGWSGSAVWYERRVMRRLRFNIKLSETEKTSDENFLLCALDTRYCKTMYDAK